MTKQTKATFKLLEGVAIISKAITSLQTRGKKYESDLHQTAVSCLNHAGKHGDITLANRLIEAIPTLTRKNALKDWFLAFGKFKWDAETKKLAYDKTKATLLEEAIDMPFWSFKSEPEYKPFDFNAAIQAVLAKAKKAKEKGETLPDDKIEALSKLVEVSVDF